jgi:CopG family nickel-responsive transcriptional regulator
MSLPKLVRFGVSVEEDLFQDFEEMIAAKGYTNRSEAIRDLMRDCLLEEKLLRNKEEQVVGSLTFVYNHQIRDLSDRLTEIQHFHHQEIISALHIHLDEHNCLEVLVIKGLLKNVQFIAGKILSEKGVLHGKLLTVGFSEH